MTCLGQDHPYWRLEHYLMSIEIQFLVNTEFYSRTDVHRVLLHIITSQGSSHCCFYEPISYTLFIPALMQHVYAVNFCVAWKRVMNVCKSSANPLTKSSSTAPSCHDTVAVKAPPATLAAEMPMIGPATMAPLLNMMRVMVTS